MRLAGIDVAAERHVVAAVDAVLRLDFLADARNVVLVAAHEAAT